MKYKKILKLICFALIFIFLFSYIIETSYYYEYNLQNKKNLTKDAISAFEKDVKEGKDIDLEDYLTDAALDYSNKLTRTTVKTSIKLNDYLKSFLTDGLKVLAKLVS